MNKKKFNVVIVGSGFSGLASADILSEKGLSILVIEENFHIGGQILRKIPETLGLYPAFHPEPVRKMGFQLIDRIHKKKIRILNRTKLIGIYPGNEILIEVEEKRVVSILYDFILFSTGARERFLPFKGWTLPGVYSTGLVQAMMKSYGIRLSDQLLIGGSGLFLLAVGYEFLKNKGKLFAICEQSPMLDKLKFIPLIFHQSQKLLEGGRYLGKIFLSGVPLKFRTAIVEARGNGKLEEVVIARMDTEGKIVPGTEKIYQTEALAIGYGFVANIELPQLAGCRMEYHEDKGGWVVQVNENLETSVENIFAAGEVTGIGGALKSIHEGELVANSILFKTGKIRSEFFFRKIKKLSKKRTQDLNFGRLFNSLYKIPSSAIKNIPDDIVVCRCEDVRMGDIKDAISRGFMRPGSLKIAVRVGMGNCQGRTCVPIVHDILSAFAPDIYPEIGQFSVRPPVKTVSLSSLVNYQTEL